MTNPQKPNKPNQDNCLHIIHEQIVPFGNDGGYSIFKTCIICYYTEGITFFDKDHEIRSLKNMLDDGII